MVHSTHAEHQNRHDSEGDNDKDRLARIVISSKLTAIETAINATSSSYPNRSRLLALIEELRDLQ